MEISDVLEFQIEKRLFSLCKKSLEELEKLKTYIGQLEKIMENAGFDDKEYKKGEEFFKLGRKIILDETNSGNRELQDLIKKYIIALKK